MSSADTTRIRKAPTGITGFDRITGGGLPAGRTTLIEGGPGTGKTVLALQSMVNGARIHGQPGIFVAFEEPAARIRANVADFGWDLHELEPERLCILDAQPTLDAIHTGSFDLSGLLAGLDAKVTAMGACRVVLDAVDVVLAMLSDPRDARRELYRLHDWLLRRDLTAVITAKQDPSGGDVPGSDLRLLQFMVDSAVALRHDVVQGISQRSLRVVKYRGSAFDENEAPFIIGDAGFEVAHISAPEGAAETTDGRLSTGIRRLDNMLDGGYLRGASILVTGAPGTAKTTLCGTFLEAACERGERALMVSFDSSAAEIVRNLRSVGIDLDTPRKSGLLRIEAARAIHASSEIHLMRIKDWAEMQEADCLVIDPVSALAKAGNTDLAHSVVGRLVDWAKGRGMTLMCSSLMDHVHPEVTGTPLQISTIADTWIHLEYHARSGERNRGLSIIKSRGTSHSNQVREMVLSSNGVDLTDVFMAGGEVLMGSLRLARERAEEEARRDWARESKQLLESMQADAERLNTQLRDVEEALHRKHDEIQTLQAQFEDRARSSARTEEMMRRSRRGDPDSPAERGDE